MANILAFCYNTLMLTTRKITANSSFFLIALILQKILSFVYFTILARNLGAEFTGQYFFAISFATMFAVLMDLGLSPVLTREVAKDDSDSKAWFRQIFSLKLVVTSLAVLFLLALNTFVFAGDAVQELIYLTTLIVVLDSFTLLFYAFIRGQQNLKFEAGGTILFQLIVMAIGLPLLYFTDNLLFIIGVLFVASLFNLIYSGFILYFKYKIKLYFVWNKNLIKKIFLIAWPFAAAAIFAKVYAYVDIFLIKLFLDDASVGFYSVAYKITFAWQFIPLAFVAALYPAFSHLFKQNSDELQKVFNKSFSYLGFIALPLSIGIIVLAPEIINQIYTTEFSAAILPLQVLIASIAFLFMNFVLSSMLNAGDKQIINTRNLGVTMILNIILNIIFIQYWGVWGAALASSISTLILFSLNLYAARRLVAVEPRIIKSLLVALIASFLMAWSVMYFKEIIWWPLTVLIGATIYLGLMFMTKTLKFREIIYLKNSLFNKE
jgi:O-antigen/teichoic acid export membrane protein